MASQNKSKKDNEKKDYALSISLKNTDGTTISVYESRSFMANGDPKGYNIDAMMRDKQANIYRIYQLLNYYVDTDPIYGGAIKKVLTPFSVSDWRLNGASEKTKQTFYDYYDAIGLNDLLRDIFFDLYLYGNVFIYDRGTWFDILPPHKIRISDVSVNGEPLLEYKIEELSGLKSLNIVDEKYIKILETKYKGYPPEIVDGIKNRQQWIQLNPENTYSIQDVKSRWEKYSIPFGVEALKPFSKKNLISEYENSQLNLGMKGFLHVKVGDKEIIKTVTPADLTSVGKIFKDAINGFPLAVTAWNVESNWIEVNNKMAFDKNKYASVNSEILSSCGLASIIITGDSEGSSFAQATVNTSIAEKRIATNQKNVEEFIKKINKKRALEWRISEKRVPSFIFEKVTIQTNTEFRKEVMSLFQSGLISYKTVHEKLGYDHEQEKERKTNENENGYMDIFTIPKSFNSQGANSGNNPDGEVGRPEKDDTSRKQDKNYSKTGTQPKPSKNTNSQ